MKGAKLIGGRNAADVQTQVDNFIQTNNKTLLSYTDVDYSYVGLFKYTIQRNTQNDVFRIIFFEDNKPFGQIAGD